MKLSKVKNQEIVLTVSMTCHSKKTAHYQIDIVRALHKYRIQVRTAINRPIDRTTKPVHDLTTPGLEDAIKQAVHFTNIKVRRIKRKYKILAVTSDIDGVVAAYNSMMELSPSEVKLEGGQKLEGLIKQKEVEMKMGEALDRISFLEIE